MSTGRADRWLLVALVAVLTLPLAVGLAVLRRPTWQPVLDLAMTELRLRDVGGAHTPRIGLPGRIGTLAEQGSHPGPLSFYGLAPTYKALGSTAWAMQVGAVVLNVAALAVSLWLARRRGGRRLLLITAALLALLTAGYGISPLTEPWNPYLPMLWWVAVLLGAWSVLAGDIVAFPVVVAAGSLAAQTHLPYTALAGAMVGLLVVVLGVRVVQATEPGARRSLLRWLAGGLLLGVVLWLPPVVEQLDPPPGDTGNLSRIADSMLTPTEDPVGLTEAVGVALRHLDGLPFITPGDGGIDGGEGALVESSFDAEGSVVVGAGVLAVWLVSAGWTVAHRRRNPSLAGLHVVVAVALVLGLVSISRIYGKVWYYLTLWAWGTTTVLLLAVVLTGAAAVGPRLGAEQRRRLGRAGAWSAAGVIVVSTVAFVVDATDAPTPDDNLSATLGELIPGTVAAIEAGEGAAVGADGRYLVTWNDAFYFGSQGFGLVSELEREGLDARADYTWRVPVTHHRALGDDDDPADVADATVALATGIYVEQWRAVPGAVEVAFVEPRDAEELAEFAQLRTAVLTGLRAEGLDDLVEQVDGNLFGASIDERLPSDIEAAMARMLLLGQETAIFLAPPGAHL